MVEIRGRIVIDKRIEKGWYDKFTYLHSCTNPYSPYYKETPLGDVWCIDYEANRWGNRGHNI